MSAIFGFTFDIGRMTEVLTPDIYRAHCILHAKPFVIPLKATQENKHRIGSEQN